MYFDNFLVGAQHGNIIEENHYYAYGLKIAAISSRKLGSSYEGKLKNNYLYQGAFSELDEDIGWNDYALRNYDAQTGRWVQQDPYQEFATPYTYVGNDPINVIDPSGGKTLPFFGVAASTTETVVSLGEVVVMSTSKVITKASSATLKIAATVTIKILQGLNVASNIINTSISTNQAGDDIDPYARGFKDAYLNAMSGGMNDLFLGTNLNSYDDDYEKLDYLKGRLAGDGAAIISAAAITDAGVSGGTTGALASGPGAPAAAFVGGLTVGYGFAASAAATHD